MSASRFGGPPNPEPDRRAKVDGRNVGRRRKARPLVPGKTAPVSAADVKWRGELLAEIEELKRRLTNITKRLERQLGDAEIGTVDGRPAIRRVQTVTAGRYVRQNHRDDLHPV